MLVELFLVEVVVDNNKVDMGIAGKEIIGLGIAKINKLVFGLAAFFDNLVKTIRIGFVRETVFQAIIFENFFKG